MTHTDNNTTLDEKVRSILRKPQGNFEGYSLIHNDTVSELIQLVIQTCEQARIDELQRCIDQVGYSQGGIQMLKEDVDDRLKQLKEKL